MGVGKTTVCQRLKTLLDKCAFLDGDWCWDMDPYVVTDETNAIALDNICHHLNSFLKCSAFENIVFCWVMHQQEIINSILERIDTETWRVVCISLVCDAEALEKRLQGDVEGNTPTGCDSPQPGKTCAVRPSENHKGGYFGQEHRRCRSRNNGSVTI